MMTCTHNIMTGTLTMMTGAHRMSGALTIATGTHNMMTGTHMMSGALTTATGTHNMMTGTLTLMMCVLIVM